MDWNDWEPLYREIVAELGLDPEADMASAMLLRHMTGHLPDALDEVERLLRGMDVTVYGPALRRSDLCQGSPGIAAGSAAGCLMELGVCPDIVVTDLDGDMESQLYAAGMGALMVVHAHGDNADAIREWVPMLEGPVLRTTQARPFPGIHNFGGFTDGDRAVFLALHLGASSVTLRGFDLEHPVPKPGADPARKRAKLAIAKKLLSIAKGSAGARATW